MGTRSASSKRLFWSFSAIASLLVIATAAPAAPPQLSANPANLAIFPARGQTPDQQRADEATSYDWATQQTGWDPYQAKTVLDQQSQAATTAAGAAVAITSSDAIAEKDQNSRLLDADLVPIAESPGGVRPPVVRLGGICEPHGLPGVEVGRKTSFCRRYPRPGASERNLPPSWIGRGATVPCTVSGGGDACGHRACRRTPSPPPSGSAGRSSLWHGGPCRSSRWYCRKPSTSPQDRSPAAGRRG